MCSIFSLLSCLWGTITHVWPLGPIKCIPEALLPLQARSFEGCTLGWMISSPSLSSLVLPSVTDDLRMKSSNIFTTDVVLSVLAFLTGSFSRFQSFPAICPPLRILYSVIAVDFMSMNITGISKSFMLPLASGSFVHLFVRTSLACLFGFPSLLLGNFTWAYVRCVWSNPLPFPSSPVLPVSHHSPSHLHVLFLFFCNPLNQNSFLLTEL